MPAKQKRRKAQASPPKAPSPTPSSDNSDDGSKNRCICGDNDNAAKRPWFRCDACECFQHPDCMDRPIFADELDDHYLCEQCKPDEHTGILAAVARGERPWEARIATRLQVEADLERRILSAIEQTGWFWDDYRPDWFVPPGMSLQLPPPPPKDFKNAMRIGVQGMLADLELYLRRDLATSIGERVGEGSGRVLGVINQVVDETLNVDVDWSNLGILAEALGRASKGRYWKGWRNVPRAAKEGWAV